MFCVSHVNKVQQMAGIGMSRKCRKLNKTFIKMIYNLFLPYCDQ